MRKPMSDAHKAALAEGRRRAAKQRASGGNDRVRAYLKWLRSGSKLREIPTVPSDADFHSYYERYGRV